MSCGGEGSNLPRCSREVIRLDLNAWCPRFASVLWTLTWVQGTSRALLRERHSTLPRTTPPLSFSSHFSRTLITDPHPKSVPTLLDRAPSRNSPVSRDERLSRHFSTALSQHIAATSTPASTRQIAKFDAKSNVFKILRITSLM
jgi:hypothetical protein